MTFKATVTKGVVPLPQGMNVNDGTTVDVIIPDSTMLGDLLIHAGSWQGQDAEEIVEQIYASRSSRSLPIDP